MFDRIAYLRFRICFSVFATAAAAASLAVSACTTTAPPEEAAAVQAITAEQLLDSLPDQIPNNVPIPNARGYAASFGTDGFVDLTNAFFTPHGTNGRRCGTCHRPEDGWSISGRTVAALFQLTGGTHPLFANHLDTDTPTADMSTEAARWAATTMLRQGKFVRRAAPPALRDYDVIAASDPFGVGTVASLFWFRRSPPTANLRSPTVMADGANTVGADLHAGLSKQARGAVVNALQAAPAPDDVIEEIVGYESQLAHAQLYIKDVGRLDDGGAQGGPAAAAAQPFVAGRFDLYDAWRTSSNAKRRQIWRGQELFNNVNAPSGRRCGSCHSAANNGENVNGLLFDVGAARPQFAKPDMAVYTFQSRATGQTLATTDPGLGIRDGAFANLGKFKVPNLRGLLARAPYFHGGTADDLPAVVRHYEAALGFIFTAEQEADLVAFLEAL
jgi:cytochrome c peroxidase